MSAFLNHSTRSDAYLKAEPLPITLHVDIPGASVLGFDVCLCRICGNQDPKILLPKKGEDGSQYLNIHALEMFYGNDDDRDNLCRECSYFANLDINIEDSSEVQTRAQPYLLVTGIFLSPAFWVVLALPMDYPVMMLISAIAIMAATVVGICLCIYGYGLEKTDHHEAKQKAKGRSNSINSNGRNRINSEVVASTIVGIKENAARMRKRDFTGTRIEEWFKGTL